MVTMTREFVMSPGKGRDQLVTHFDSSVKTKINSIVRGFG